MPNTREKLIELLKDTRNNAAWHHWGYEESADHLIANGVGFVTDNNVGSKWISVKDRLPEQYRSVIVWTSERELGEAQFDGKHFEWCADEAFADVTHWMPLPEPPKGE